MASNKLSNYLRTHRKRLSLSQEDVAYLLGVESSAKVCRHEKKTREPSLKAALAYEAVYHKPVSELFAGLYQEIERKVMARAEKLAQKDQGKSGRRKQRLRHIADARSKNK